MNDINILPIDDQHQQTTFFSDYVQNLLTKFIKTNPVQTFKFLHNDFTFNWTNVDLFVGDLLTSTEITYDNDDDELFSIIDHHLNLICPLIVSVSNEFETFLKKNDYNILIDILDDNLFWTGSWKQYLIESINICHHLDGVSFQIRVLLALSLLTSYVLH